MKIIVAYPCLGKTTIYQLNKDKCFDREFCESRSTLGMTQEQQDAFFDNCAGIVRTQYQANYHKILFITEDERLLSRLEDLRGNIILVFPNADNAEDMADYKQHILERSGQAWWNRVIEPEVAGLSNRLAKLRQEGWDLRLVNKQHPYIEDVVEFPVDFILPIDTPHS